MSTSILETQRRTTRKSSDFRNKLPRIDTRHKKLGQAHSANRINRHLDRIQSLSQSLLDTYADANGARKAEIASISNAGNSADFTEFYNRLKDIKDHHRRHPDEKVEVLELEVAKVDEDQELEADYKRYLAHLVEYLEGFCKRALPLLDHASLRNAATEEVNEWAASQDQDMADPSCSVTLHKKAAEVFAANGGKISQEKQTEVVQSKLEALKEVKLLEVTIQKLGESLVQQREDTRDLIERKQTLSVDEIEKAKAEDFSADEEEEEENNEIYNPLKLPMGWDGKPIPYWLFKLHGLGVEYPCEICGNFIYMGRKAFDRHFQEWRHAHGMKCLGIPNLKHFQEITKISDAFALWEKLNTAKKAEAFKAEAMEEFEDAEGNVFNKKTFEDLRRQGLL
ncbi:hypothetical protein BCR33DRAFT_783651 [Rhizoclosmatium globosum]|uniref:Matrin-type domain-containing protein n=1 Tax=Rhizoclosmatium globosum TaxID=329046 RepID=A0A1Y2CHU6_9FUNG|nr:hypothetical protein BCR33DRAFT_783651 [Rhizoclosmatium globosum]|eukprot:ORY46516.1 hypothetical protein BCR33DRAFT_783651 [Rhizoclosmatium globosum]